MVQCVSFKKNKSDTGEQKVNVEELVVSENLRASQPCRLNVSKRERLRQ